MELIDHYLPRGTKEFKLAPIGDIQFGHVGCDAGKLQSHMEYGLENGWTFLGMGDYLDHFSPSNLKALKAAKVNLYDSANEIIDTAVESRLSELVAGPLKGSEGRWCGVVEGDHTWTLDDGQPIDALLAKKLKSPYLGSAAIIRVHFPGACDRPLKIFVTHGGGSSISATGKTLHLERLLGAFDVDVVLMGHSHLKYGVAKDKLMMVDTNAGPRLVHETKILGITGSFLNGYKAYSSDSHGWPKGSYVEQKGLSPHPTGGLLIQGKPTKKDWGWKWDLFVSS